MTAKPPADRRAARRKTHRVRRTARDYRSRFTVPAENCAAEIEYVKQKGLLRQSFLYAAKGQAVRLGGDFFRLPGCSEGKQCIRCKECFTLMLKIVEMKCFRNDKEMKQKE